MQWRQRRRSTDADVSLFVDAHDFMPAGTARRQKLHGRQGSASGEATTNRPPASLVAVSGTSLAVSGTGICQKAVSYFLDQAPGSLSKLSGCVRNRGSRLQVCVFTGRVCYRSR
jgi:hypothetical protein